MVLSLQGRSFLYNLPLAVVISLLLLSICLNTTTLRHLSATATPEPESHVRPLPLLEDHLKESVTRREQADSNGEEDSLPLSEVRAGGWGSERGTPGNSAAGVHTLGQDDRLVCGVEGCLVSHVKTEDSTPLLAPETSEDPKPEAGKVSEPPSSASRTQVVVDVKAAVPDLQHAAASAGAAFSETLPPDKEKAVEEGQNFALACDGAKVIAANKEARKPDAILDCDGDTFLKNECKADKWIIIELSQIVKPTTLVLSQYELYSGRIQDFEVRVRQDHPRHDGTEYAARLDAPAWTLVGRFTASNTKGTQAFRLPPMLPWAKYLQLRVLSHYGTEAVCALNDIRVHGKSAIEDFEDSLVMEARGGEASAAAALLNAPDVASGGSQNGAIEHPNHGPPSEPPEEMSPGAAMTNASTPATAPLEKEQGAANDSVQVGAGAVLTGPLEPSPAVSEQEGEGAALNASSSPVSETPAETLQAALNINAQPVSMDAPPEPAVGQEPAIHQEAAKEALSTGDGQKEDNQMPTRSEPVQPAGTGGAVGGAEVQNGKGEVQNGKDLASGLETAEDWPSSTFVNTRHTTIYDMLVQDLKLLKLQQKAVPRQLADLQRNLSADISMLSAELAALAARVAPEPTTQLARKEDTKQSLDLLQLQLEVAVLRGNLDQLKQSQLGLGLLVGALAALLVLRVPQIHQEQRLFKLAVTVLAVANGIVGLLLQHSSSQLSKATWNGFRLVGL